MRVEHQHFFETPLEAGFAFITDTANWPRYWPGFVKVEEGSSWTSPGDVARIVVKLMGREVELHMTLRRMEENRLVEYDSTQEGLPDARHERHFSREGDGFRYRLVVDYEPRAGLKGFYDRLLVSRGIRRAFRQTVDNLDMALPR